jgi:hypothetical protein
MKIRDAAKAVSGWQPQFAALIATLVFNRTLA